MSNIQFSTENEYDLVIKLDPLFAIWEELGVEEDSLAEYKASVKDQLKVTFERMHDEVKGHKKRVLDSLEKNTILARKLSQELGVSFEEPDESLALLRIEQAVRHDVKRMQSLKEERLEEVKQLRKTDEDLCSRLGIDPFYISVTTVPTTKKLNELKEHIESLEKELIVRRQEVEKLRDSITKLYQELEMEPSSKMEMDVVCESLDRFTFSTENVDQVKRVFENLQQKLQENQRVVMECVDKIDKLYERLQLDNNLKFQFLAENRGHSMPVIESLKAEIHRLEEIRRQNIEKFTWNIRKELDELWDKCYYSEEQRNNFLPLHSCEFTEDLLEAHEAEANRLREHYEVHKSLFEKVSKWQEIWDKYQDLERKAKDPSRLMNARGNALLIEEKERKLVNKQMPKIEQELHSLIKDWEQETGSAFLVGGRNFEDYIECEKEKYQQLLEDEKIAREQAKKKNLMKESRFGAKPSTPAKLKQSVLSNRTSSTKNSTAGSSKTNTLPIRERSKKTPASSRMLTPGTSRILSRINTGLASLRSPRSSSTRSKITPGSTTMANTSKARSTLRQKKRDSYGIKKDKKANKAAAAINKSKMTRGVLAELDNSIVSKKYNFANTLDFDHKEILNSTSKTSTTLKADRQNHMPGYMTPTKAASNKMFKTPTTTPRTTRGMSALRPTSTSKRNLPSLI
eukprot:TRINITY_DN3816_c0_g1_i5.p1 TRINITY_DN3816_c0_g1~~TRINITY_DN3816_c0_g1_i5.p1  ORF type:complete len:685 (-),score=168.86 TRINITY_DN3816_c0_g1_i5:182-2236(-)